MRSTIYRDKAGTTEYEATVRYVVPLADPKGVGNLGLEGADEFSTTETHPTWHAASVWANSYVPDEGEVNYRELAKIEWVADEYDDDKYGTILDAERRVVESWWWDESMPGWSSL